MLRFYFSPFGRISRKDFWLKFILVLIGLSVATVVVDSIFFPDVNFGNDTGPVELAMNLVTFWPQIALTSKRFHDRNMSGWWQIPFNIAVAAGAFFAYSASLEIDASGGFDPSVTAPLLIGVGLLLIAGGAELVILGFLPGTRGPNKYGDDPLNPMGKVAEVFS